MFPRRSANLPPPSPPCVFSRAASQVRCNTLSSEFEVRTTQAGRIPSCSEFPNNPDPPEAVFYKLKNLARLIGW